MIVFILSSVSNALPVSPPPHTCKWGEMALLRLIIFVYWNNISAARKTEPGGRGRGFLLVNIGASDVTITYFLSLSWKREWILWYYYWDYSVLSKCFCWVRFTYNNSTLQSPEAESKEKHCVWEPMPELNITSPYVHSRVDSITFTMGNPMPESTLTLCQSRLYPTVWDFGFGLRILFSEAEKKYSLLSF
jgi:hypothetical protein